MKVLAVCVLAVTSLAVVGATSPPAALTSAVSAPAGASAPTAAQWIARFQTAWDALKTYKATVKAHEELNGNAQDRTYILWFQKPTDVRLDVTAGDNKGSVAVYHGGDRVVGHRGGIFSLIKLNLDIHNKLAVSLRGTTIAQASFGAVLDHMKSTKWKSSEVLVQGDKWTITSTAADPSTNQNILKEVATLGANGLPIELVQYEASGVLAKHVVYPDVQVDVDIPASTWQI